MNMSFPKTQVLFLYFLIVLLQGFSQSYKITGQVTDAISNEPLPGASVVVEATTNGTTTKIDGTFELKGIKQQKVKINISFIGYASTSQEHDFGASPKAEYNIKLKPSLTELEQVQIEAESEGQVKAFIKQKEAANIKNIVSSDQIENFPDMNAAEAMQRIPGITLQRDQGEGRFIQLRGTPPELTSFNVNGEQIPSPEGGVRYVGMDVIAADQIEFIEVTKVLTPDMDADAIAGSVNIITKRAKSSKPEINATIAGGYSSLRGTGNGNVQFLFGTRTNDNKFGVLINGSYFENHYGSDNMEFKYVKSAIWGNTGQGEDNYIVRYREFQLRHYDIIRKRTGLSATLDYKFNDHSFIYLSGMYNSFSDDEIRRRKVYDLDDPLTENYFLYGGVEHDVKDRTKLQSLNTLSLGGEHRIFNIRTDYSVSYAAAGERTPNRVFGRYENPGQALAIKFDYSDPEWPKPYFPKEDDRAVAENYEEYEFDRLTMRDEEVKDNNVSAKLNFTIPYLEGNRNSNGFIKIGGKVRFKEKERDYNVMSLGAYDTVNPLYPGTAPELTLPSMSDGFMEDDLLGQGYELEYIPNGDNLYRHYEFYPWFFIMSRDNIREETTLQDYLAKEDIYAAYIMIQHDFQRLMVQGGLRYEKTDIYYEGRSAVYHPVTHKFIDVDTVPDSRQDEFINPYLQFKYKIRDDLNLRLGATYTFSRPNFEDVIPFYEEDEDGDIQIGNPDLLFPRSLNIDFLAEKYLQGNGILSGALFFKDIENFVVKYTTHAHFEESETSGFITVPINGVSSYVYGFEGQSQFKFLFLPGFLKDFGLYLNYTYTYSDAKIPKRKPANYSDFVFDINRPIEEQISQEGQEHISYPGQAKHAANVALFYESGKFYAKFSGNYHDKFLKYLGADKDLDLYYDSQFHLDFTTYYAFNKHFRIFGDAINLTNQPQIYFLTDNSNIVRKEYYYWSARLGIKISF
jgi:TonB-dependent receptor